MKTLVEIRAELEVQYPTLTEVVDGVESVMSQAARSKCLDEWAQGAFEVQEYLRVKRWANVQAFMDEFTIDELGAIGASQNAVVVALRVKLSGWLTAVHADHPLVVQGKQALVASGILSSARASEIFDVA